MPYSPWVTCNASTQAVLAANQSATVLDHGLADAIGLVLLGLVETGDETPFTLSPGLQLQQSLGKQTPNVRHGGTLSDCLS
ncbi:hypothetical protein ACYPKM_01145 [Pseudomonas aeruginosa]